jgi:hypothetical protein
MLPWTQPCRADAATWGREKEAYARAGYPLDTTELPDYLPLVLEFASEVPEEGLPLLAEHRAAIEVIRRSLRHDAALCTPPHPATIPLDGPLVSPGQEWLDFLECFISRV